MYFKEIPGGLPDLYQKVVDDRTQAIESWRSYIKSQDLPSEKRKQFRQIVEKQFQVSKLFTDFSTASENLT